MTDLRRIEIAGFKGIESLEFEPSGVNLVTGRNNTGKTSLLEAIALAFDPTYVEEFGEDVDSLIHRDFEECRITVETEEGTREMEIRHPREEEVVEHLTTLFSSLIKETIRIIVELEDTRVEWHSRDEDDPIHDIVDDAVPRVVQNILKEYITDNPSKNFQEDALVIQANGDEYPYVVPSGVVQELLQELLSELVHTIENDVLDEEAHVDVRLNTNVEASVPLSTWSTGVDNAFLGTPPSLDDVDFIKSKNLLSAPEFEPDSGDAIKRDDLGDYIKETGLLDELKTFNLDDLVFQREDGEKYSVPYDFMGDGFKTVVGLLWELMDDEVEDQIVLLEEPENHMHPGYVLNVVHFLIELARDEDVQLFITTHNKDFIDAFFNENRVGEQEAFLEDEFTLLQMQRDSAVVEDYETAREDLEELHLDLRGI